MEQEKPIEEIRSPSVEELSEATGVHISFTDSQAEEKMSMEEPSQDMEQGPVLKPVASPWRRAKNILGGMTNNPKEDIGGARRSAFRPVKEAQLSGSCHRFKM